MNAKFESVEDDAGKITRYVRHANGGGLVAPGAEVAQTARIGHLTYVEYGARIGQACRVGRGTWIDRDARIGERVVIGDGVRIGWGAVISDGVHIGSHSRVGSRAVIGRGIHLHADSTVPDGSKVPARSAARRAAGSPWLARKSRGRLAA